MKYVIVEDSMVVNDNVPKDTFPVAIEAPDDIVFGDHYVDGAWVRDGERPIIPEPTPEEKRGEAYRSLKLIDWQNNKITVDEANRLWQNYLAELNEKADILQEKIIIAKTEIRQMYPEVENE